MDPGGGDGERVIVVVYDVGDVDVDVEAVVSSGVGL